ncbi:trimethylamine methyltransferase family protein [Tepidibacter hydrothermalis]|uniref:Methyltransferase n=1 Tax=Tepidibacter hydrothermalis TaxID=3036126 RepID=A0ABY8EIL9_9FIRM|nr:trimethylamine methyltransferase family protein [Tepidibacter hydrothermalis]WFD11554.1 trimethylamine methyltransferase family protein [Tepidibacter hydrothermalis]
MNLASNLRILKKGDLDRIHEATVKILEETGIKFVSLEVREIFKKHGAKVEGEIVYISRKMLDDALKTAPSSFKWWGVDESNSIIMGEGQKRTHISPNNGPIYIQDLDNGKRLGTMEDLINLYKLCQAFDVVDIIGAIPVDPSDIDNNGKHLQVMYQLLKHTNKPLIGFTGTKEEINQMFDMVEIVIGKKDYLLDHPTIGVSVNPLSPLKFDDRGCTTILEYARKGQPIFILTCALAGVSGPISLMGTAVLQNAEILAGMVLTQLINPGTPFVYSPASTVANMKKASYITGTPEANIINIACMQLAHEVYNLPSRSMAGLTDSKVVDCQAGYETMQNVFGLMTSGTQLINECLGVIDSIMTTSYEKFILDVEMMSRVLRFMEGMDTSEKSLSIDVIKEVGHEGSYITHPSTFKKFRSLWTPLVSDWNSYNEWEEKGKEDVVIAANRKYKEILKKCPESVIDLQTDKDLKNYIKRVCFR